MFRLAWLLHKIKGFRAEYTTDLMEDLSPYLQGKKKNAQSGSLYLKCFVSLFNNFTLCQRLKLHKTVFITNRSAHHYLWERLFKKASLKCPPPPPLPYKADGITYPFVLLSEQ